MNLGNYKLHQQHSLKSLYKGMTVALETGPGNGKSKIKWS